MCQEHDNIWQIKTVFLFQIETISQFFQNSEDSRMYKFSLCLPNTDKPNYPQ